MSPVSIRRAARRAFPMTATVLVFIAALTLSACTTENRPEAEEPRVEGNVLESTGERLAEPAESGGNPADGAMGSGQLLRPGSAMLDLDEIAGEWLYPQGTGGVAIDDEPSVSFFATGGGSLGPYDAFLEDDTLWVLLEGDEIDELFGEGTGMESVSFAFALNGDDELAMLITDEESGGQQYLVLTRGRSTATSGDADSQVEANVELLVQACLSYAYEYGTMPAATDVDPDGAIAGYLTEWPTNPYTGKPLEYVSRQAKDGNYEVDTRPASVLGMFARRIRCYYDDGTYFELIVPYEQVGL